MSTVYRFQDINPRCPVDGQLFVWLAEYFDGTGLAEFDFDTKEENKFSAINKDKLISFGLVGNGNKLSFSTDNGLFDFNGSVRSIVFEDRYTKKRYVLSGNSICNASDIITFKQCYVNIGGAKPDSDGICHGKTVISEYCYGYKNQMSFNDGFKIAYKVIVHIPLSRPPYMEINITANENRAGSLIIQKKFQDLKEIKDFSLIKDTTSKTKWNIE